MNDKNKDLKTEIVEPKEEEKKAEPSKTSNSSKKVSIVDVFKKLTENKLFKYMFILIGFLIVFLIVMFLISVVFPKKFNYGETEAVMEKAAMKYFNDNPNMLPQEEMAQVNISAERLAELRYMKPLDSYLSKKGICNGTVTVTKNVSNYNYVGYLDCGKEYVTQELYKKIVAPSNVVTGGYGIYNINNEFVFRGEIKNNYVKVDDYLFRIVKVDSNNDVVLILDLPLSISQPWDDRYNNETKYSSGINDYSVSRIKDYLGNVYNGMVKDTLTFSDLTRQRLAPFSACIGPRSAEDTSRNNSAECSKMLKNQTIALLTVADYMNASADTSCQKTIDKACRNYNFLAANNSWWLMTPNAANTHESYMVTVGDIVPRSTNNFIRIRTVIHLSPTAKYSGGTGTEADPYTFR